MAGRTAWSASGIALWLFAQVPGFSGAVVPKAGTSALRFHYSDNVPEEWHDKSEADEATRARSEVSADNICLGKRKRKGARQHGREYSSDEDGDGPQRSTTSVSLTVPATRASIYVGLPSSDLSTSPAICQGET